MVQEVLSALSTAAGIYILAKNKGEQKGQDDTKKQFEERVEELAAQKAAEEIAKQQAEEAAKDPRYRSMYFGDKEESYDPFYDYSNDPVYFNEEMLEKANTWKDRMCHAFRARFVSPIVIESKEVKIGNGWWTDARESLININVANQPRLCRDFFSGKIRYYILMLEVFNPINAPAPLKKICFKDIEVGGKKCQVLNEGGFWSEASAYQMYRMNRKWYNDAKTAPGDGLSGGVNLTYIPKVYEYQCEISIPARSSVYVCVMLPLGHQREGDVKLYKGSFQNIFSLCSQTDYVWNMFDPSGADFNVGGGARLTAEEILARQNVYLQNGDYANRVYRRVWDAYCGCECFIMNGFVAPDSLTSANIGAKVLLCSSDDNFVQEGDPEGRTPKADCPSFDLKMLHGSRPISSGNQYDWQNSYFDEWEGELPISMVNWSITESIESLSERLLGGMDIEYLNFNKVNLG